jgi:hypothetical protein
MWGRTISGLWRHEDGLLGFRFIIRETTEASGSQARFSRRGFYGRLARLCPDHQK